MCEYPTDILAWDRVEAGIIQSRLALRPLLRTTFVVPFVRGPWVYASVWVIICWGVLRATPAGFMCPPFNKLGTFSPAFLRKLAQRKHFPAINWNISFSKYIRSWAFKVLHSLICRVQAAGKGLFSMYFLGLLICKQKQQILFGTKQPLHGKVFWSHTSRSMTQSTATWQLEETCYLSSLRTFFMSHDWNNFYFVPLPQSCTCRFTVWVPQALEMHIPSHVSPCVR